MFLMPVDMLHPPHWYNPALYPQLLTNHYEQCWKYYCLPSGWGSYGLAVEEELHLTEKLFWGVFDSLSHKVRQCLHLGIECLTPVQLHHTLRTMLSHSQAFYTIPSPNSLK
jgi:hypothetical protein